MNVAPHNPSYIARLTSLIALLIIISVIGVLFYRVMVGFFVPLFIAGVLVVIFRPLYRRLEKRLNGRRRTAALITTITAMLVVLLPIGVATSVAAVQGANQLTRLKVNSESLAQLRTKLGLQLEHNEELAQSDWILKQLVATDTMQSSESSRLKQLASQFTSAVAALETVFSTDHSGEFDDAFATMREPLERLNRLEPSSLEFLAARNEVAAEYSAVRTQLLGGAVQAQLKAIANPGAAELSQVTSGIVDLLQPRLVQFTQATTTFIAKLVLGLVILVLAVYFFLVDGPAMVTTIMRLSPLDDQYEHELLAEFDTVSRAVVLATILSAVTQGILAAIGYYFAGLHSIVLLMLLTMIMAMIPFFGAASVWIPCAIWVGLAEQRLVAGVVLTIYGICVVSSIDNVIKAFVLHGKGNLHPLLALLSVLGGVASLGPIGILVGPMCVAFLQTLLSILQRELSDLDRLRSHYRDSRGGDDREEPAETSTTPSTEPP
jgi:predicted PurR-regulated permease PerM